MKKSKLFQFKYLLFDIIRIGALPGLLWFRPKRIYLNKENKKHIRGGALIVANHITIFDPMYIMIGLWYRRHHFIAMQDFFNTKGKRFLFTKVFSCIPIDRDNVSIGSIKSIVNHLKSGEVVSMFPEGHVNSDKEGMKNFKSGMVMMSMMSGAPIIPIYLKRRKHFYSRVVIGIGEAIKVNGMLSLQEMDEVTKRIEEQEHLLENLCERKVNKND